MSELYPPEMREKIIFLMDWALKNHCRLELEGSCGFGRECVGILARNDHYPLYNAEEKDGTRTTVKGTEGRPDWSYDNYVRSSWVTSEAYPPRVGGKSLVPDAYHKVDCLAVLGRGPPAIEQLYLWVKHLEQNGIVVKMLERKSDHVVDLLFHGLEQAVLTKGDVPNA